MKVAGSADWLGLLRAACTPPERHGHIGDKEPAVLFEPAISSGWADCPGET